MAYEGFNVQQKNRGQKKLFHSVKIGPGRVKQKFTLKVGLG
jgi:hypothetical protein